jgi:hypothetical protein
MKKGFTIILMEVSCLNYYNIIIGFWDADGVYFNKDGYDKHGGYYDDDYVYCPGKGWNYKLNCYESELGDDDPYRDEGDLDDGFDDIKLDDLEDDGYDDDFDDVPKIQKESKTTTTTTTTTKGTDTKKDNKPNQVTTNGTNTTNSNTNKNNHKTLTNNVTAKIDIPEDNTNVDGNAPKKSKLHQLFNKK